MKRILIAALLVGAMSACGSDDEGPATSQQEAIAAIEEIAAEMEAAGTPVGDAPFDMPEGDAPFDSAEPAIDDVAADDVQLTCGVHPGVAEIVNTAAEPRSFHLTMFLRDIDGVRVDESFTNVSDVQPGERVREEFNNVDGLDCDLGRALSVPSDQVADGDIWWPLP